MQVPAVRANHSGHHQAHQRARNQCLARPQRTQRKGD